MRATQPRSWVPSGLSNPVRFSSVGGPEATGTGVVEPSHSEWDEAVDPLVPSLIGSDLLDASAAWWKRPIDRIIIAIVMNTRLERPWRQTGKGSRGLSMEQAEPL